MTLLPEATVWTEILQSNALNVILALTLLVWLSVKFKLGDSLSQTQTVLSYPVTSIEQEKKDTQHALQQLKQRSESLHREIDTILMEARVTADAMAQQIIAHAEEDAKRLKQQAKRQAEQDETLAKETLQARFMAAVLADVREILAKQTQDPEYLTTQRQQIDSFIHALPERAHCLQGGL